MLKWITEYFYTVVTETPDFFMVDLVDVKFLSYSEIEDMTAYHAFAGIIYGPKGFVVKILKASL